MAYTTIDNPALFFNTVLYTGNGSTNTITGVGFQPDWVWIKNRSNTSSHNIFDAVRGVTKAIFTNATDAEATEASRLSAFNSDGFTINGDTSNQTNESGSNFVSWNWKAGGSASSNSNGSITSSVSANTTAGFSIVSYTGTGSAATIGHGLSTSPSMILVKNRSTTYSWIVYHKSLGATKNLYLDLTNASDTSSIQFNDTEPTSSVFSVGTSLATNKSGDNLIAYCFAEKAGYSKFGSYTGNGADQQFIYTGFAPKFLLFKGTSNTSNWILFDDQRLTYNATYGRDRLLFPVDNSAEQDNSSDGGVDMLSNGFCFRGTASMTGTTELNESGASYIYMAFAEAPFVTAGTKAAGTAR